MERHLASTTEAAPAGSLFERLVRRAYHWRLPPELIAATLAVAVAMVAGIISIQLARSYYTFTVYYPDASAYRMSAVLTHQTLEANGLATALRQSLGLKDGLDVTIRVLFAPSMLVRRFGHMVVAIPLMAIFVFLVIWYVFTRTRSLLGGALVAAFLFTSGMIYGPYAGIADYWKDSLGCWLLGSACMTWLLAEQLQRRRWAFLSGLFLGLLLMQRTGAAVYVAPLFAVLFVRAAYGRLRLTGIRRAASDIALFVAPALVLVSLVVIFQLNFLYSYYFGAQYAYGGYGFIARVLKQSVDAYGGLLSYLLPFVYVICLLAIVDWREQLADLLTAAWLVAGFPAMIILSKTLYTPGFHVCLSILMIVLLATLMPRRIAGNYRYLLLALLSVVAISGSAVQYVRSTLKATQPTPEAQATRDFYLQLANALLAQPAPRSYKLIFTEAGVDFQNLLYFDFGAEQARALPESAAFFSVHDSYYQTAFGNLSAQQIVQENVKRLEGLPGTMVVADCEPQQLLKRSWFAPNPAVEYLAQGNPLAANIAVELSEYVLHSPHWKAINRLQSPFGCMYIYLYTPQSLSAVQKWQQLGFVSLMPELPLTLAAGPSVRMYGYSSHYPAEQISGVYYQWLPAGRGGLQLSLFSDLAQTVTLDAHALAGPARKDRSRTLVIANGLRTTQVQIQGEQDIEAVIQLQPGLNQVEVYVQDLVDTAPPGPDKRELMLLLISPRLELPVQ